MSTSSEGQMAGLSRDERVDQVARAHAIAVIAHHGQVDKLKVDYINHPAAVAGRFDPHEQTLECCAAWLHDVIEDTEVSAERLRRAGVHAEVIEVVQLLTRRPGEGDEYYDRIAAHPAAKAVKISDIRHNTDPTRTSQLDPEKREELRQKYEHALEMLDEPWPHHSEDVAAG